MLITEASCTCSPSQTIKRTAGAKRTRKYTFACLSVTFTSSSACCPHIQLVHAQVISEVPQAALVATQLLGILRAQARRHLGQLQQVIDNGLAWVRTEGLQDHGTCENHCDRV